MKTNFWSLFKKMFNDTSYCSESSEKFKKDCHVITEKNEFKKLKLEFDNRGFVFKTKDGRAKYDRMRTLGKKYGLKYKRGKMNKIKGKVETVLMLNPDTRNCDFELVFDYWYRYCGIELTEEQKARIKHGPSIHTIFRHRAYIQNEEGKFKGDDATQYQRQSAEIDYRYNYGLSKEEKLQKFNELKNFLSK